MRAITQAEQPLQVDLTSDPNDADEQAFKDAIAQIERGERDADAPIELPSEKAEAKGKEEKPTQETVEQVTDETKKPDNSEPEPEKATERDAKGRFVKKGEAKPEEVKELSEGKPAQSEYEQKKAEKKAKEEARLEKTWQNANLVKEQNEQRRAELEAYEQQIAQQWEAVQKQAQRNNGDRPNSKQVFDAAREFYLRAQKSAREGDIEKFEENLKTSEQLSAKAQQFRQAEWQEQQQFQKQQLAAQWQAEAAQVGQANPDLLNPESDLYKEVDSIFNDQKLAPIFNVLPYSMAVDLAKLRIESASASELRDKNTKLEAENKELNRKLGLSGGAPAGAPAPKKSFDNMSDDEMEKHLLAQSAKLDRGEF
jgi:hypothetical protein